MPRERPEYRDNYEALVEHFPNKMLLTAMDVAAYCGIDPRTARRRYAIGREGITIPTLARRMSQ
jgi:hypothetical protein